MTINSDYAQYREYGLIIGKLEWKSGEIHSNEVGWTVNDTEPHKEPEVKKDDTKKSNVISPKWLKNGRARAKL